MASTAAVNVMQGSSDGETSGMQRFIDSHHYSSKI